MKVLFNQFDIVKSLFQTQEKYSANQTNLRSPHCKRGHLLMLQVVKNHQKLPGQFIYMYIRVWGGEDFQISMFYVLKFGKPFHSPKTQSYMVYVWKLLIILICQGLPAISQRLCPSAFNYTGSLYKSTVGKGPLSKPNHHPSQYFNFPLNQASISSTPPASLSSSFCEHCFQNADSTLLRGFIGDPAEEILTQTRIVYLILNA